MKEDHIFKRAWKEWKREIVLEVQMREKDFDNDQKLEMASNMLMCESALDICRHEGGLKISNMWNGFSRSNT